MVEHVQIQQLPRLNDGARNGDIVRADGSGETRTVSLKAIGYADCPATATGMVVTKDQRGGVLKPDTGHAGDLVDLSALQFVQIPLEMRQQRFGSLDGPRAASKAASSSPVVQMVGLAETRSTGRSRSGSSLCLGMYFVSPD